MDIGLHIIKLLRHMLIRVWGHHFTVKVHRRRGEEKEFIEDAPLNIEA